MKRVIVVEHDDATIELLAELLASEGLTPLCYPEWPVNLTDLENTQADLLILDLEPGDPYNALERLGELRRHPVTRSLPVIVNSTDERMLAQLEAKLRDFGCAALSKPFDLNDFIALVGASLNGKRGQAGPMVG